MRDPYLYDDVYVLKNKLDIKDHDKLEQKQSGIVYLKMSTLSNDLKINKSDINYYYLLKLHKYIFGDIYDWAGQPRVININKSQSILNGLSVNYSDYSLIKKQTSLLINNMNKIEWNKLSKDELVSKFSKGIADIWKVHPFREGNTRTIMIFALHFAKANNFLLNQDVIIQQGKHMRDSLVMASIGEYSEFQYLEKIFKDAINKGLEEIAKERCNSISSIKNNREKVINKNYEIEI